MKKVRVTSCFNYSLDKAMRGTERKRAERPELIVLDQKGEEVFPPEKVVPNKALKPKDVIDRFTRGLPVADVGGGKPVWNQQDATHDSPDLERLRDMDPMDRKDFARSARVNFKKKPNPDAPIDQPGADIKPKS